MTPEKVPTENQDAVTSEAEPWLQFSDWARDAGDRACCVLIAVAAAVAMVLVGSWVWTMPSFG